jgi:cell division protein FtsW
VSVAAWMASLRGEAAGQRTESDRWLLLTTIVLVCAGLAMVLSASQALASLTYDFALYYFVRQVVFAVLGLALLLALRGIDYHRLRRWAPALAGVAVVLMVATLVPHLGRTVNGGHRWLSLGPLGTIQPSELAKLAFVLYMAHWVERRRDRLHSFGDGFVPFLILLGGVVGLLMLQPDTGTAIVTCAIFVSIYFAGGGRKRYLALMVAVLLGLFALLTILEPYRLQRIMTFTDPFKDPLGSGFQSTQALLALGSGGLTGVGLGHSVQKYGWLPEAHTDFIFAIVGEETGLLGTTLILTGFVALAARGYRAAARAPDRFGVMVATGITTWIAFQGLINMGTVSGTLPVTGLPLPFISYGGTALAVTMAAMGVLLNVASQGVASPEASRRMDATADRGRRNWRAPFASPRRRPSVPRRAPGG